MRITKEIYAAIPGEVYPKRYAAGDEIPEALIDTAKALGALEETKMVTPAVENKMVKTKPENKMLKPKLENKGKK